MNRFTRGRFSKSLICNIICLTSAILSGCASHPAPKYVLIDDGVEKVNFLPEPIHPLDQSYELDEDFAQLNESQIRVDKAVSEFNEKYLGSPIIVVDDHEVIKFHDRFTIGEHERYGGNYPNPYYYNYQAALALGREGRAFASFFRSDGMPLEHVELAKVLYKYKWISLNEGNPNYDEALPLLWGAGGAAAGVGGGAFAAGEICEGFVLLCVPMVGVGAVVGGVGGIAAGAAESERRQEQRNYPKSESNKQYWELLRWALSNDEVKRMLSDDGYEDLAFNFSFPNRFECTQASDLYAFTGVTERRLERQYEGPNGGSLYDALVSNDLNPYEVCVGNKIPQHLPVGNPRWQFYNIKTHWAWSDYESFQKENPKAWSDYESFQKENPKILVRIKAIAHLDDCGKNTDKIELYTDKFEPIEPLLHTCKLLQPYTPDNELNGNATRYGLMSYFLLDLQSENDCVAFLGQIGDKSSNKILRFPVKLPRFADGNSMTTASSEFCQRTVSLPTVDEIPIPEILYELPSNLFLSDNWKPTPYDKLVTFLPETWCLESIDGVIDYSECAVFNRGEGTPMYQGREATHSPLLRPDLEIEGYRHAEGCSATLDEINDTCSRWKLDFSGGYLDTLGKVRYGENTGVIWMWYVRSILEPLRPGAWVRDDSKYWLVHPDAVFAKFPDGRVGFVPKGVELPDELKVKFKDPYDFVVPGNTWRTPSAQIPPLNMIIKTPY